MPAREPREERVDRRAEILRVAAELIAERGYAATTVRDIGDRVGLPSGNLYYYFASKEVIALEIVHTYISELRSGYADALAAAATPTAQLRRLIEAALDVSSCHRDELTILCQDWAALNAIDDGGLSRWMREVESQWRSVIERGIASGEFRADLPSQLVFRTVMGAIAWVPTWQERRGRSSMRGVANAIAELTVDGLEPRGA
jgi:AcrR family transcriptional regulator